MKRFHSLLIRVLFKLNMKFEMRDAIFSEVMFVLNCSVLVLVTFHSVICIVIVTVILLQFSLFLECCASHKKEA